MKWKSQHLFTIGWLLMLPSLHTFLHWLSTTLEFLRLLFWFQKYHFIFIYIICFTLICIAKIWPICLPYLISLFVSQRFESISFFLWLSKTLIYWEISFLFFHFLQFLQFIFFVISFWFDITSRFRDDCILYWIWFESQKARQKEGNCWWWFILFIVATIYPFCFHFI